MKNKNNSDAHLGSCTSYKLKVYCTVSAVSQMCTSLKYWIALIIKNMYLILL